MLNQSPLLDPREQALLSIGASLLQAGAPRIGQPVSMGAALGGAVNQGMGAYQQAQDALFKRGMMQSELESAGLLRQMTEAKIEAAERDTKFRRLVGEGDYEGARQLDPIAWQKYKEGSYDIRDGFFIDRNEIGMGNSMAGGAASPMPSPQATAPSSPPIPGVTPTERPGVWRMPQEWARVVGDDGISVLKSTKTGEERPDPAYEAQQTKQRLNQFLYGLKNNPVEFLGFPPTEREYARILAAINSGKPEKVQEVLGQMADDRDAQTNKYREEFNKKQNHAEIVLDVAHRAQNALETGAYEDGARQVEILYGFVKGMDRASAVREGEISLAEQASSLLGRFSVQVESIRKGQIIPNETARELAQSIVELGKMAQKKLDDNVEYYKKMASLRKLNYEEIITPTSYQMESPDDEGSVGGYYRFIPGKGLVKLR